MKAAWTGNLSELRLNLPDSEKEDAESSTAFKEFASAIQKSGKERAFCGLFAAAVRGHLPICKAILKEGKLIFGGTNTRKSKLIDKVL